MIETVRPRGMARPIWLAAIVGVGAVLRLQQAIGADFPLGDGGLFLAAVDGIRGAGTIPSILDYNGGIPFVYPPLGFVISAIVAAVTGMDTLTALRVLPPVLAILALALVPWVAMSVMRDRSGTVTAAGVAAAGLVAAAFVATMPQAYDHLVAGGGITRGIGVVLALAAIALAGRTRPSVWATVGLGILLGLAGLSHPRVAMFAAVSVAFVWWRGREDLTWQRALLTVTAAALTVAPWLLMLASRDQVGALLAGTQRFDPVVGLVSLVVYPGMQAMHGGIPNIAVALSIVGVLAALVLGRWQVVAWLLAVHLLNPPPFVSAVAWAIAGAEGIVVVARTALPRFRLGQPVSAMVAVVAFALVTVTSAAASPADPGSKQQPLLSDQVDAARAMRELPEDATFAVVTSETWGNDIFGEWLPALSDRRVATTPQGSEWLGPDTFDSRVDAHGLARQCAPLTSDCLADTIQTGALAATHFVIPRGPVAGPRGPTECCPALVETIRGDPRFEIVQDTAGALVVTWR